MTEDSQVDSRDLRDPTVLGRSLLAVCRDTGAKPTMVDQSQFKTPNYPSDHTTVTETVAAYMQKMQNQAAQGDLAATRVLLDKGWALPEHMDHATLKRAQEMQSVEAEVVEVERPKVQEKKAERQKRVCWGNGDAWYHNAHTWENQDGKFVCPGK